MDNSNLKYRRTEAKPYSQSSLATVDDEPKEVSLGIKKMPRSNFICKQKP